MKHILLALLVFCLYLPAMGAGRKQPNIILILADDAGYSDFGCYGGEIETPALASWPPMGCDFPSFTIPAAAVPLVRPC